MRKSEGAKERDRALIPLITLASVSLIMAAVSVGQVLLPVDPTGPPAPAELLSVQFVTEDPASTELLITQDVTASASGRVGESFTAYIAEEDGWAAVSEIVIGWTGGAEEEWNCNVFPTPNPDSTTPMDIDFDASYLWPVGGTSEVNRLEAVREARLPGDSVPTLATVRKATFNVDGSALVSGVECSRETDIEWRANARVAIRPTLLLIDLPELDRVPIAVRYNRTAVNAPREWRLETGSVDNSDGPDEAGDLVTYLGGTTAAGKLGDEMIFAVPGREQWINVSFAILTVVTSTLLGMVLQAWSERNHARRVVAVRADPATDDARSVAPEPPTSRLLLAMLGVLVAIALSAFRARSHRDR